jgi:putative endonuclease
MPKQFYVYIMANSRRTVLYTGVTNDLKLRAYEHREGRGSQFTKRYRVTKLVYYEVCAEPTVAIEREKQIKAGTRAKKLQLVRSMNPNWNDLYEDL